MRAIYTVEYEECFLAISKPLGRIMREIINLQEKTGRALQDTTHSIAQRLRNLPPEHSDMFALGARFIIVHREQ